MHHALMILGVDVSQHVRAVAMKEYDIADILLRRLPQLKHLSLSINNKHRFVNDPNCKKTWHIPICSKVHLRIDRLSSVAGFSILTSLHIAQRQLGWPFLTLPTLRTLSLGPSAVIQRPPSPSATAPNITTLRITVQVCNHSGLQRIRHFLCVLQHLPNLRALFLTSNESRFCPAYFDSLGHFSADAVYALLDVVPALEDFTLAYNRDPVFVQNRNGQLSLRRYGGLRRIQMAEGAFARGVDVGVVNGVGNVMGPALVLPRGIETVVVTPMDGSFAAGQSVPERGLLGWLEKLDRPDFPDLKRVEVRCLAGVKDRVFSLMSSGYAMSEGFRKLRCAGVEIEVRIEKVVGDVDDIGSKMGGEYVVLH
ncbi:hypothetical protein J1614_007063 [Plenodomus biglobosus]|nr:hypothetical protein J1614_007063 [Plenodomus biglobosus]